MQVTPGGWMYCHSYCNAPLVFLLPINKQSPSKVESSPFFCSVQFCCRSMQHSCCGHHYLRASKGFFCCFKLIRVEKWAARTQVSIARKKQMCSGLTSLSAHEQIRLCSCKVLLTVCRSYYFSPNLLPFLFFSFFSSPPQFLPASLLFWCTEAMGTDTSAQTPWLGPREATIGSKRVLYAAYCALAFGPLDSPSKQYLSSIMA